jgi:hypothetical protein
MPLYAIFFEKYEQIGLNDSEHGNDTSERSCSGAASNDNLVGARRASGGGGSRA